MKADRGFTIIECMLALALMGILLPSVYSLISVSVKGIYRANAVIGMTQAARCALERFKSGADVPSNLIPGYSVGIKKLAQSPGFTELTQYEMTITKRYLKNPSKIDPIVAPLSYRFIWKTPK